MNQLDPDKSGINLIRIQNEREIERFNLDELAQKVIGKPVQRDFPIYLVLFRGRLAGYFHAVQKTVIHPAFDLEAMHAGDILKIARSLATELKRHTGDPLFVICKQVEKFREGKLHCIRLKKAEETLYYYDEEAP
jgi:hypothetical protein